MYCKIQISEKGVKRKLSNCFKSFYERKTLLERGEFKLTPLFDIHRLAVVTRPTARRIHSLFRVVLLFSENDVREPISH